MKNNEKTGLSITVGFIGLIAITGLVIAIVAKNNNDNSKVSSEMLEIIKTQALNVQSLNISDSKDVPIFTFPKNQGKDGQVLAIAENTVNTIWKYYDFIRMDEQTKLNKSIVLFADTTSTLIKGSLATISENSELVVQKLTVVDNNDPSTVLYTLPTTQGKKGQVLEYRDNSPCRWVQLAGVGIGNVKSEQATVVSKSMCFFKDETGKIIESKGPTLIFGVLTANAITETKKVSILKTGGKTGVQYSLPNNKGNIGDTLVFDANENSLLWKQQSARGNTTSIALQTNKTNQVPLLLELEDDDDLFRFNTSGVLIENDFIYAKEFNGFDPDNFPQIPVPSQNFIISSKNGIVFGNENETSSTFINASYISHNIRSLPGGEEYPLLFTGLSLLKITENSSAKNDTYLIPPTITKKVPAPEFQVNSGCIIDISNLQLLKNVIIEAKFLKRNLSLKDLIIKSGETQRIISVELQDGTFAWIASI
jgi:hypothetical protein